ncbi:hypothetical protein LCGC14_2583460 [marine sediment metagenome]|uniref:HTH hxlR-type domain-containing protein n=1 Tax=marine sediment metagenome TaxID=412755 RepID=A0A0F9B1S6_9ZZZZ
MKSDKWGILMVLGKPYAIDILEALFSSPKRFSDLNEACGIEKTRIKRLKELKEAGLVEVVVMQKGKRDFIHYKLTEKGDAALRKAKEF